MLVFSISVFGQVYSFKNIPTEILDNLDKMGVDKSTLLNSYESAYFNVIFKDSKKDFDFTGKKVGFIASAYGNSIAIGRRHGVGNKRKNHGRRIPRHGAIHARVVQAGAALLHPARPAANSRASTEFQVFFISFSPFGYSPIYTLY